MTQNQLANYHYRHSEVMLWHTKHPDHDVECMLIGVDFEGVTFRFSWCHKEARKRYNSDMREG